MNKIRLTNPNFGLRWSGIPVGKKLLAKEGKNKWHHWVSNIPIFFLVVRTWRLGCLQLVYVLGILAFTVSNLTGQSREDKGIQTNDQYTATQLIRDIFIGGDCFEVRNIHFSGAPSAMGFFEGGKESIDIEKGVILSTGNISNIHGPNISTRISTDFEEYYPSDKDLETLLNSKEVTLEDVVVLEFDFTPTTHFAQFQYAFASEEYCDYVGSKFNDVFGFFLSGPGIDGPFENGAENIAFVPGTSDFVAINNINHLTNNQYFVNNVPMGQIQFVPCDDYPEEEGIATDLIEFDGFTKVLTAVANVIPCETYHIKLAIADASDALFDSAVFLKANSFNAGGAAYVNQYTSDSGAVEGCQESYFLFERTDEDTTNDLVVHFQIAEHSTATAGQDYEDFPDSIIIPAGELTFELPIQVHKDETIEGQEQLIMELESACSCADLSISLPINDYHPLAATEQMLSICGTKEITITPNITGGVGPFAYQWNTGDTLSSLQMTADTSITFEVTVTDGCQQQITNVVPIQVLTVPTVEVIEEQVVCDLKEETHLELHLGGTGPWQVEYSINDNSQPTISTNLPTYVLPIIQEGLYTIDVVSNANCFREINTSSKVVVTKPESAAMIVNQPICYGEFGFIELSDIRGGQAPYQYSIDGGFTFTLDSHFDQLEYGDYEVIVKDRNNCLWQTTQTIIQPNEINLTIDGAATIRLGETLTLLASIDLPEQELQSINWSHEGYLDCATCLSTLATPLYNTQFELIVSDQLGCVEKATFPVQVLKNYQVFVPSAFSPNGDGHNDLFFVNAQTEQVQAIRSFQVINRWGDLIYEAHNFPPNDPQYGWDGSFNGQMLTNQVFAYFVEVQFIDGEVEIFKGDVTLIRGE